MFPAVASGQAYDYNAASVEQQMRQHNGVGSTQTQSQGGNQVVSYSNRNTTSKYNLGSGTRLK